eukprot:7257138-Prymnesium_polylepis.1
MLMRSHGRRALMSRGYPVGLPETETARSAYQLRLSWSIDCPGGDNCTGNRTAPSREQVHHAIRQQPVCQRDERCRQPAGAGARVPRARRGRRYRIEDGRARRRGGRRRILGQAVEAVLLEEAVEDWPVQLVAGDGDAVERAAAIVQLRAHRRPHVARLQDRDGDAKRLDLPPQRVGDAFDGKFGGRVARRARARHQPCQRADVDDPSAVARPAQVRQERSCRGEQPQHVDVKVEAISRARLQLDGQVALHAGI